MVHVCIKWPMVCVCSFSVLQGSAFCMFACALQLEVRLAGKEESLLEKDLIFEQVTRLCDRVKNKAESGKTDTLNLAKDVSFCLSIVILKCFNPLNSDYK